MSGTGYGGGEDKSNRCAGDEAADYPCTQRPSRCTTLGPLLGTRWIRMMRSCHRDERKGTRASAGIPRGCSSPVRRPRRRPKDPCICIQSSIHLRHRCPRQWPVPRSPQLASDWDLSSTAIDLSPAVGTIHPRRHPVITQC